MAYKSNTPTRGIYAIKCADGRAYVGASVDAGARWSTHRYALGRGNHRNKPLQKAWDEMGEGAFTFAILEQVASQDILTAEQKWMDRLAAEGGIFNRYAAHGTRDGSVHTDKVRRQMSRSHTGLQPGSKNPLAKLTESDVLEIRRLSKCGVRGIRLAAQFDVSRSAVSLIIKRLTWAHI